jgi:hypothetical protein
MKYCLKRKVVHVIVYITNEGGHIKIIDNFRNSNKYRYQYA